MRTTNSRSSNSQLELSDIVDLSHLQAVHDIFSKQTGLASAILDEEARPITFECNHCPFCKEVRRTKAGVEQCRTSDRDVIKLAKEAFKETGKPKPVFHICRQGLVDFCAPIVISGEIIAYFFSGQFRCTGGEFKTPDQPTLDDMFQISGKTKEKMNIDALEAKFQDVRELDIRAFKRVRKALERLADQLNSFVKKLDEWKRVKIVDDFMIQASKIQTVEELFDLTISSLPKMMEAKHCSIFTVQRGETQELDRLVLRKTSYQDLKSKENSAYYEKGEGLTGWVWKHARSLRLINLQDPAELALYDDLNWEQKYNDSDDHTSFLCVPMFGRNGRVIGVIRMPHKIEDFPFFMRDEIFLNFLASHLSWVIECQAAQDEIKSVFAPGGLVDVAQHLASAPSYSQILDAALKSSLKLFGEDRKIHFVCSHKPGSKQWKIERVEGRLPLKGEWKHWKQLTFSIDEGFTGRVIRMGKTFFSPDLDKFDDKSEYLAPVVDGKSAISAPLCSGILGWEGEVYGAISIISSKEFDFSKEKELLLGALGRMTGSAIKNAKSRLFLIRIMMEIAHRILKLRFLWKGSRSQTID